MTNTALAAVAVLSLLVPSTLVAQESLAPEALSPGDSWKLCMVKIDLVRTSGRGSQTLLHEERLMFLGEQTDLEQQVRLESADKSALLELKLRIRATAALDTAGLYTVTTEAVLVAALGFVAESVERDQFRHELVELRESSTHVHEVCRLDELDSQVLLFLSASPVGSEPPEPELFLDPPSADLLTMKIEAFQVDDKGRRSLVQSGRVATGVGRGASLEFVLGTLEQRRQEEAEKEHYRQRHLRTMPDELYREPDEKKGERRFGEGVRAVEIRGIEPSGFAKDHIVRDRRPARDYKDDHQMRVDKEWLDEHAVDLRNDDLIIGTVTRSKKISKRKRKQLRALAEAQAAADRAIALSKQLPGVAPLEEDRGDELQRLLIRVEPLFLTEWNIRFELHVQGSIAVPGHERLSRVDARVVESVAHGESLEIDLATLTEGLSPGEYVLSITPGS